MRDLAASSASIDAEYEGFSRLLASRAAWPLFATDVEGLWEAYLGGLPERHRQHYNGSSHAADWGLAPGAWVKVKGVCPSPAHWSGGSGHHAEMAMFVLEGARDRRYVGGGLFFPETLRAECHGIRRAMEAYSRGNRVADPELGTANGVALQKGQNHDLAVRVTTALGSAVYVVDRWE